MRVAVGRLANMWFKDLSWDNGRVRYQLTDKAEKKTQALAQRKESKIVGSCGTVLYDKATMNNGVFGSFQLIGEKSSAQNLSNKVFRNFHHQKGNRPRCKMCIVAASVLSSQYFGALKQRNGDNLHCSSSIPWFEMKHPTVEDKWDYIEKFYASYHSGTSSAYFRCIESFHHVSA